MSNEHHTGPGARARRALIVVDVQPTFCEGGALAVTGGNAVAERIAAHLSSHRGDYDLVVTTQDWHIDPGEHFSSEPDFVDTWPVHGVAGSAEAQIHPALDGLVADAAVKKGQYAAAYSGFEGVDDDGRSLDDILRAAGIEEVDVVGLAESHCVKDTALDAVREGYRVRVLTDLTEPVSPELGHAAQADMRAAGIELAAPGCGPPTPSIWPSHPNAGWPSPIYRVRPPLRCLRPATYCAGQPPGWLYWPG